MASGMVFSAGLHRRPSERKAEIVAGDVAGLLDVEGDGRQRFERTRIVFPGHRQPGKEKRREEQRGVTGTFHGMARSVERVGRERGRGRYDTRESSVKPRRPAGPGGVPNSRGRPTKGMPGRGRGKLKDRHLVFVAAVSLALALPVTELAAEETLLEEIVVTAERRTQNEQDVATALQAFTGQGLERRGADGFEDYVLSVPGLSFRDQGAGATRIAIRGISNVSASDFAVTTPVSTVGLYLNDVPIQGTSQLPDLNLYDLEQIEVLKGPQGTLYGEGAMGGAIRMTLARPDPTEFSARGEVIGSFTDDGGFNNAGRGVVNIPIAEGSTALRIVGTYRDHDGFVDNIARDEEDANSSSAYSVRALAEFVAGRARGHRSAGDALGDRGGRFPEHRLRASATSNSIRASRASTTGSSGCTR